MKNKPLYIIGKNHHWCNDLSAQAVNSDLFFIPSFKFIKNSKIRNIFSLFIVPFYSLFLPNKKIYLVSDAQALLLLNIKKLFYWKKFSVIHVVFSDYYSENHKGLKRKFMNLLAKVVDGAIVPGEMLKKEIKERGFIFPVKVSYHYPKKDDFFKINSGMSKNVISIGIKSRCRKGEDLIYKIAKEMPNTYFYILGNKEYIPHKLRKKMENQSNINLTGFVKPEDYISLCTFYLLPGRYDAGPISLNEAMASGLIPLISNKLGGQDLVKQVREDLVIDSLNPKEYIKKLREIQSIKEKDLKRLSNISKKVSFNWTKIKGMKHFKKQYTQLIGEIK